MVGSYQTITYNRYADKVRQNSRQKSLIFHSVTLKAAFQFWLHLGLKTVRALSSKALFRTLLRMLILPIKDTGNKMHGGEHSISRSKAPRLTMRRAAQIRYMNC